MAKMNHWRASKLYGRPTLDWRYEYSVRDRAEKWLQSVERNRLQRHPRHRERRSFGSVQSRLALNGGEGKASRLRPAFCPAKMGKPMTSKLHSFLNE
jgi:hypothetical protein